MFKRRVSKIMLTLLMLNMLTLILTFNIMPIMASTPVGTPKFWLLAIEKFREFDQSDGQFLISELLKYENWNNSTKYTAFIHLLSEYTSEEVDDEIKPYLYGYPRRSKVESEIKDFLAQADPGDIVIVYIACHGYYHYLNGIGISYSELDNWLSSGGLQHTFVTVILETCHSGSSIKDGEGGVLGPNRNVLCACMSNESCSGWCGEYMFFSRFITEGFALCEDYDNDGWVSVAEVFDYAKPITEERIEAAFGWSQHPVSYYGKVEGDVPLVQRDITKPFPDMPPLIIILSPQNVTYMTSSIPLTFAFNEPASWMGYSLDGHENVTITGNTTLTDLADGVYDIMVYANDTSGNMGASNKVFFTVHIPKPPIVNFTLNPHLPKVGEPVTFDASLSTPNGGTITKYYWDFGDGENATGQIITHAYSNSGTYTVTLNVTDSEGLWDMEQKQIQVVQPYSPKAEFTATPETADIGESVKFDASASLPAWNGTHEMPITEYRWDFGGSINITTPTPILYYSFISPGIYYVTLTVYAPGATPETDSITHKVTVISVPVGGYSFQIKGYTIARPLTLYLAIVAILTASFTIAKRRKKQQN